MIMMTMMMFTVNNVSTETGEGPVDLNKFKGLYRKKLRRPQELEKDMRQAFRLLDNTGTGKLSEADLRVLLGSLGEPLTSEEVRLRSSSTTSLPSSSWAEG
jgi:Ca2+-binding EF-hand superfamily protein